MKTIIGDYAFVSKVNVSDVEAGVKWYQEKLGFVLQPQFSTPVWAQLVDPDMPNVSMGLSQGSPGGTGDQVTTFVVVDIIAARDALINKGVKVSPIENYPPVQMAYFVDPFGNALGLRQNP